MGDGDMLGGLLEKEWGGDVPADFEGGGGDGGELGRDGEDAVEFPVRKGEGNFGGDAGEDSEMVGQLGVMVLRVNELNRPRSA